MPPIENEFNKFGIDFGKWLLDIDEAKTKLKCADSNIHAVLYTDGGCRPSPHGDSGWGIHGYLYTKDKPKMGHGCKTAIPNTGGYVNMGSPDAVGMSSTPPVTVLNYIDSRGGLAAPSTNNEAELLGLCDALAIVKELKPESAKFILDSQYVLKGCKEWLPKWVKCNWVREDGSTISNKNNWLAVKDHLEEVSKHTKIDWQWVKGHSDNMGNIIADSHATSGLYAIKNTGMQTWSHAVISQPKNYWSPVSEIHPMVSAGNCLYFRLGSQTPTLNIKGNDLYVYNTGTGGRKDDGKYFGKPDTETAFCTLALNEVIPSIECVRRAQNKYTNSLIQGSVILARLDTITNANNVRELEQYGSSILHGGATGLYITNGRDEILSRPLTPPRKSLEAAARIAEQELRLVGIFQDTESKHYVHNDITGLIYDWVEKKNVVSMVMKKDLGGDTSSMDIAVQALVNGNVIKEVVSINLGIDTPRTNVFGNIAHLKPIITIVTHAVPESSKAFRYSLLIELTETKEYALWEAPYSNIRVIV